MMDFLLDANTIVLPERMPTPLRVLFNAVARRAVVATLPRWMRKLGATTQSGLTDRVAIAVTRPVVRAIASSTWIQVWALRLASPRTAPIIEPVLRGVPPVNPVVREPAEALIPRGRAGQRSGSGQSSGTPGWLWPAARGRSAGRAGSTGGCSPA